nr:hypothetical protein [uncultured Campylobacter sp.]
MKINLNEIYAKLKAWRAERKITAKSQKEGFLVNVMEELGELATALREYEKFSKHDCPYCEIDKQKAEHEIIDALCDISVFTINAGADIPCQLKPLIIETKREFSVASIFVAIADFIRTDVNNSPFVNGSPFNYYDFARILRCCASVCEQYGFDFQIAMDETIKEISSRTGSYDEVSKKWVKDESDEARAKWYQANYELARLKNE